MEKTTHLHSEDWIEKLTIPTEELTPSEREELEAHVQVCPTCFHIRLENEMVDRIIQSLPGPDFPPGVGPKLSPRLTLERLKARRSQARDQNRLR